MGKFLTVAVAAALLVSSACSSAGFDLADATPPSDAAQSSSPVPVAPVIHPERPPETQARSALWSCVADESAQSTGPLRIEVVPAEVCAANVGGTIRITNSGDVECGSDIMASLGSTRFLLESKSGFANANGTWGPMPDDIGEGVGYVPYPPGTSEWTVRLPDLPAGQYSWRFVPGVRCGDDALDPFVEVHVRHSDATDA